MTGWWDKQIDRADHLAANSGGSKELLVFYAHLLRAQREIYKFLRSRSHWLPCGDLNKDLCVIREAFPGLLKAVAEYGPKPLAAEARGLSETNTDMINEMLVSHWRSPTDVEFFAKAFLQPYALWLAETGTRPPGRELTGGQRCCPFCGGKPQVSFLQNKETTAESGNRDLICATCLSSWEFRRVICANCGEERPTKLGYFHTPQFDHVRIEACDTCKHYLKGIDLTRNGLATPLVDEIDGAPLDLWAREHGYSKIELNLVGI